ncbi:MAG: zinc metalloprotease [Planctomycetota bacterium]
MKTRPFLLASLGAFCLSSAPAFAAPQVQDANLFQPGRFQVYQLDSGLIVASDGSGTTVFQDWDEYLSSSFFMNNGARCGMEREPHPTPAWFAGSVNDCSASLTVPDASYNPGGGVLYDIPVVVHVLYSSSGTGNIPDARIFEQIQILNEDFGTLSGGNIQFHLATVDPSGNATTGITRHQNTTWYNDGGSYAASIGWDTTRYLNIYTNTAGGNLGYAYVPSGGGVVGASFDGVRILWNSFGYTNYTPYHLGRTTTHEVGHYLGLYHTFQGGCHTGSCYSNGDLICDTNTEQSPNYSGCSRTTCGTPDPVQNFMDYSEDACMNHFSAEQVNRMRCTLENWRVDLTGWEGGTNPGNPPTAPTSPSPANGATAVATNVSLGWAASTGATGYNVYFGTTSNPPLAASVSGTSWAPTGLANSTTYFWRVVANNSAGSTSSATWSFTTEAGGTGGGSLFTEDFQSGGFTAGGWSRSSTNYVVIGSSYGNGGYGARLRRSSWLRTTFAPAGSTSLTVEFDRRASGYDSGEALTVTVVQGGVTKGSATFTGNSGSFIHSTVTANNLNSGTITLTFSTNANRTNEYAYLDNIVVTGN